METSQSSRDSFDGIQYLRAIAAIMVVVHHARHFFPDVAGWSIFGTTGVDIFFVISGFIMVHASRSFDPANGKSWQLMDFWAKRVIRVVPLYWLALLYQNKRQLVEQTADPELVADFFFIPRYNEWHPGEIWPSLVPGWTINYEMLFYTLFGLALLFGRKRHVALVGAILALVLVGAFFQFTSAAPKFWTSSTLLEFAIGIGVYWLITHWKKPLHIFFPSLVLLVGFAGLWLADVSGLQKSITLGLFAAMVVWGGAYLGRAMPHQAWLHKLGDASYSIYLTHQFTFVISGRLCVLLNVTQPTAIHIAAVLVIHTVVAIAIGLAVHQWLEKPLLQQLQAAWRRAGPFIRSRTVTA